MGILRSSEEDRTNLASVNAVGQDPRDQVNGPDQTHMDVMTHPSHSPDVARQGERLLVGWMGSSLLWCQECAEIIEGT